MWWTIFTAIDLYIGLIILDSLAGTIPAEKANRLRAVRKIVLVMLGLSVIVLVAQIVLRH